MTIISLLAAVAGAIMASGLAAWFWGFWWGVLAYIATGALILLTFGISKALRPGPSDSPVPLTRNDIGPSPAGASGEKSDAGSPQDNGGSSPESLHVRRKGQRGVVFGVIVGTGCKGGAIPLGHLPQAGKTWAKQEVLGSRVH